jgi:integrase
MTPAGGRRAVLISDFRARIERAGIQSGVVMELMRHSDLKLTMKTYTDTELVPTAEAVTGLEGFALSPEPHSQKSGAGGSFALAASCA